MPISNNIHIICNDEPVLTLCKIYDNNKPVNIEQLTSLANFEAIHNNKADAHKNLFDEVDNKINQKADIINLENYVPISRTINGQDLASDITIDALPSQIGQDGKYLTTNGLTASWTNVESAGALSELTDVQLTNLQGDSIISYNNTSQKWENKPLYECNVVIETYINGTEGYRIWNDGWCKQFGYTSGATTVTLMKTYKDTNFNRVGVSSATSTSITTSGASYWNTEGYLADGEW